jgi:hypothetical protein
MEGNKQKICLNIWPTEGYRDTRSSTQLGMAYISDETPTKRNDNIKN